MVDPYIGITDFTNPQQALAMRGVLDSVGCKHLLHVGVMMSYKTLRGIPSKWSNIFPPKEDLRSIFVRRPGVMNVLHYADYNDETGADDLLDALEYAGPGVDTIQLDMPWPSAAMLGEVRRQRSADGAETQFIIQVGRKALEIANNDPQEVANMLREYRIMQCLDYALFDLSGGGGIPMDAQKLLDFIWSALRAIPDLNIAAAGGLGPTTIGLAEPLVAQLASRRIPISLDAQSELRPSGSAMDPIHWEFARLYLLEAARLVMRCGSQ